MLKVSFNIIAIALQQPAGIRTLDFQVAYAAHIRSVSGNGIFNNSRKQ